MRPSCNGQKKELKLRGVVFHLIQITMNFTSRNTSIAPHNVSKG